MRKCWKVANGNIPTPLHRMEEVGGGGDGWVEHSFNVNRSGHWDRKQNNE